VGEEHGVGVEQGSLEQLRVVGCEPGERRRHDVGDRQPGPRLDHQLTLLVGGGLGYDRLHEPGAVDDPLGEVVGRGEAHDLDVEVAGERPVEVVAAELASAEGRVDRERGRDDQLRPAGPPGRRARADRGGARNRPAPPRAHVNRRARSWLLLSHAPGDGRRVGERGEGRSEGLGARRGDQPVHAVDNQTSVGPPEVGARPPPHHRLALASAPRERDQAESSSAGRRTPPRGRRRRDHSSSSSGTWSHAARCGDRARREAAQALLVGPGAGAI